jgi:hypothetical protein
MTFLLHFNKIVLNRLNWNLKRLHDERGGGMVVLAPPPPPYFVHWYTYNIWCLWPNIRFLPSTVTEKNATKNILDGRKDRGKTVYPPPLSGSGGIIIIMLCTFLKAISLSNWFEKPQLLFFMQLQTFFYNFYFFFMQLQTFYGRIFRIANILWSYFPCDTFSSSWHILLTSTKSDKQYA